MRAQSHHVMVAEDSSNAAGAGSGAGAGVDGYVSSSSSSTTSVDDVLEWGADDWDEELAAAQEKSRAAGTGTGLTDQHVRDHLSFHAGTTPMPRATSVGGGGSKASPSLHRAHSVPTQQRDTQSSTDAAAGAAATSSPAVLPDGIFRQAFLRQVRGIAVFCGYLLLIP